MQLITVQRAMVMGSGGSLGFGLNPIPCLVQTSDVGPKPCIFQGELFTVVDNRPTLPLLPPSFLPEMRVFLEGILAGLELSPRSLSMM